MSHYRMVAIETLVNPGEPSVDRMRARPLPGQGFGTSMRVECSSKMRNSHPPGTVFVVKAQVIDKEGGTPFLYTHFNWPWHVLPRADAEARIARGASLS